MLIMFLSKKTLVTYYIELLITWEEVKFCFEIEKKLNLNFKTTFFLFIFLHPKTKNDRLFSLSQSLATERKDFCSVQLLGQFLQLSDFPGFSFAL